MQKILCAIAFVIASSMAFADAHLPRVYIISPTDGSTVDSPMSVVFGLEGFGVAPAGTVKEKTGHHHLIIDAPLPEMGQPIPANANYHHFGGGQTQTTIDLPPGQHTLQLLLGDHAHLPHEMPIYSEVVSITVR